MSDMIRMAIGIALCALASGQLEVRALSVTSVPPNYWCTWGTQGMTLRKVQKAGKTVFAGDQGVPLQRDNLNEEVLFGKDGWATLFYPNERDALFLLLDAGWDLPYKTKTRDVKDMAMRGACIPHPDRFPSLKGTPGERLKGLNDKAKSIGWRGIGVWIPAHVHGRERRFRHNPHGGLREAAGRLYAQCGNRGREIRFQTKRREE